jgi:hypothetical protein
MKTILNKEAIIEALTIVLDLANKCGHKGYEHYVRDLLTNLYKDDINEFKKNSKYSRPTEWNMTGFKDPNDQEKLKKILSKLEELMRNEGISVDNGLFRQSRQFERRLKQYD